VQHVERVEGNEEAEGNGHAVREALPRRINGRESRVNLRDEVREVEGVAIGGEACGMTSFKLSQSIGTKICCLLHVQLVDTVFCCMHVIEQNSNFH